MEAGVSRFTNLTGHVIHLRNSFQCHGVLSCAQRKREAALTLNIGSCPKVEGGCGLKSR